MGRRRSRTAANHERWLVSYADFMTLLFALFVVMYASSQLDRHRMMRVSNSIGVAFSELGMVRGSTSGPAAQQGAAPAAASPPPSPPATAAQQPNSAGGMDRADLQALRRELQAALSGEIKTGEITLRDGHEGLVVSLSEIGFFDSGSAELRQHGEAPFARIAAILRQGGYAVRIEGHTDNVPIATAVFRSNWELSTARAIELIKVLIARYGFSPERLSAAGYAEFHPTAENSTPAGRRQNRRVDMVILAPGVTGRMQAAERR